MSTIAFLFSGYDKDYRPDIKQVVANLSYVDPGVPVAPCIFNGNGSHNAIIKTLLSEVVAKMQELYPTRAARNCPHWACLVSVPCRFSFMSLEKVSPLAFTPKNCRSARCTLASL